jgi:DNA-binding NarL/FixJ family response regulator
MIRLMREPGTPNQAIIFAARGAEYLTEREHEVLELIGLGLSNRSIARSLWVSVRTVECHVANIFDKLDLPDTVDCNRRALAVAVYWSQLCNRSEPLAA